MNNKMLLLLLIIIIQQNNISVDFSKPNENKNENFSCRYCGAISSFLAAVNLSCSLCAGISR